VLVGIAPVGIGTASPGLYHYIIITRQTLCRMGTKDRFTVITNKKYNNYSTPLESQTGTQIFQ